MYSGVAARAAEFRKHSENDTNSAQLSWKCSLAVESYGSMGSRDFEGFLISSHPSNHSWE